MQIIKDIIKTLIFFLDGLVLLLPVKHHNRVALIKTNEIGDFVLWLASARNYKEIYEGKQVVLIGNQAWAELLEKEDIFHKFIALDVWRFRINIFYRLKKLFEIRKVGAETIVNLLYSKDLYLSDAIVRCSGADVRIGIKGDASNYERDIDRLRGEKYYDKLLDMDISGCHELEINCHLQSLLSEKEFPLSYPELHYKKNNSEAPYYILFPGANTKNRQWPVANFAEAAQWIYEKTGMKGVVCGVQNEYSLAESLIASAQVPIDNLAGKTSLNQFVDKIANARFVLSNDTSAIHIACATNTPSLAILGGGHFGRFLPYVKAADQKRILPGVTFHQMDCYGCCWDCKFAAFNELVPCIEQIEVSQVIVTLEHLFAENKLLKEDVGSFH